MQLAVDVERDEDEGGTFGETFIDYVRVYVLINLMRKRRAILDFLDPFCFTFIVALRNLHMHILFPEAFQALSWSSSS